MEIAHHITIDTEVHHGAPVIRGTRIPVSLILGSLAGGMTREEVKSEYEVSDEDVTAALKYATDLVSHTSTIQISQ